MGVLCVPTGMLCVPSDVCCAYINVLCVADVVCNSEEVYTYVHPTLLITGDLEDNG